MEPLTFNDITRLFEKTRAAAKLAGDSSAIERTGRYCEALVAMNDWPRTALSFTMAANEYSRIVDAISAYLLYAPRIKKAPDPILDVLINGGNRSQDSLVGLLFETFGETDDHLTRVQIAADVSRILTSSNGAFLE